MDAAARDDHRTVTSLIEKADLERKGFMKK
jgi:hypothetical protein